MQQQPKRECLLLLSLFFFNSILIFLIVARRLPRSVPPSSPAERVAVRARRARRGETRERARVERVV